MRHRINEFIADTIRRLASTRVVEFVDGSEQKVSGIDFIGLASELTIPEWNDETRLFSTSEHAAGKDSLSPEEMFLASSESGVYCLNGIVRWLLEENMLRSEGPFLENVKSLTRRIVSMRFGELEGESWRKESERWLCFRELVIKIVIEEIDPTDLQFLQNGCLALAFDLLEARTQIEQPADLHFVEPESKGKSESGVETSSSNASDSLRTSLPSTQSTLPSDSSSEYAASLQDDMSREGDQIELEIEDPSSTVLNFTFSDQSSPQNRQKLNLMRRQWISDTSSPPIVIDRTSSLPSSSLLVTNTPLSHNPIILTEPINEDAFLNDDSEVINTLENLIFTFKETNSFSTFPLIPTLFTHLAFLLNSDNSTLRAQSYMLLSLLFSSPTHAPLLRHTRKAIRDSVSDLTMESKLAFSTIPLPNQLDPSLIPHDEPSKNAAVQQFLEFGEQISAIAPIAAPKSLDEIPQFLSEIGRMTKNDFAPLTAMVKNLDGPLSEVEQALPFLPPQFRAQIVNNVMITCVTQKLSFPSTMTNFYVSQSDPFLDQVICGLRAVFPQQLPLIFKKSFPGDVLLERAVRSTFTDVNLMTLTMATVAVNYFLPEPHLKKIHPLLLRGFHVSYLSFDETHRGLINDDMLEVFFADPLFTDMQGENALEIFKTHPPPQMSCFVNTTISLLLSSMYYPLEQKWGLINTILHNITHYTLTFGALSELRLLVLLFTHSPLKQFIWMTQNQVNTSMVVTVLLSTLSLPPLFDTPLQSLFPKGTEWFWRNLYQPVPVMRGLVTNGGSDLRTLQTFAIFRARATRADWATFVSTPAMVKLVLSHLSSPVPALVSTTLELLKTAADLRSDAFNRILLSFDAAALVMQTVESSLFLEDYENGCSILAMTLSSCQAKEQELLRNTFALFQKDSIQCLLDHLRGSEQIVSDENVGWFEHGFSEPFKRYFIPNRVVCLVRRLLFQHLQKYLSTPTELTVHYDADESARTDLAFDVLFLSLLSIVSDAEFHKPARHLLARMFQISESELERLLLEREVRRGDLEMEWLGERKQKDDTLSFAEGVWTLLGRRETEEERDEDPNEVDQDEEKEEQIEQETKETDHEHDSVEYPRTVRKDKLHENPSTPTVFLHRVACLLISVLFSTECDCLPSNNKQTASTDTAHNDPDSTNDSVSEPNNRTLSESHLFRICLKLTGWLQTTFEKWKDGSVFTKTVRMDVESAVSLVFLLLPHADLSSQCFLAVLLRTFSHFTEMVPHVITPDLVQKKALFFARLRPSLPNELVRSVEYGVKRMLAGDGSPLYGPHYEEAAELCRPILADLMCRLESDVEGRREIAAQIWVIVSSNDRALLRSSSPLVPLLCVLSSTADDETAFFLLRACTHIITTDSLYDRVLNPILIQHASAILRFGKRINDQQVVIEARFLFNLILNQIFGDHLQGTGEEKEVVELSKLLAMEFGEIVERVLRILEHPDETVWKEKDIDHLLSFLRSSFAHFKELRLIDFSPLILSLIHDVTLSQRFFGDSENRYWVRKRTHGWITKSSFNPPTLFRFIQMSPSFPTEQSVLEDVLNRKLIHVESIIRFGKHHEKTNQQETESKKLKLFKSVNSTLRVKMAFECAIRLPRLLHKSQNFLRAKQAQIEQGEETNWENELVDRASKVFSTLNLNLITSTPLRIHSLFFKDIDFIIWALTGGNRRDTLNHPSEDDSNQSEPCLSFFENLQFAVMWMLNGMVEFPLSSQTKLRTSELPFLWDLMLHSVLFRHSYVPSIAEISIQLRVCLLEEGVEDVMGAVECLLDSSIRIRYWPNTPSREVC
ncbi:hypothetical protein BLNAU_5560 [Blattamonas nauphoetae]|uniref:Uncharacterized protein n=1 Tax=Blattamonas nauphoetae TaxID=2049346 RepID=A0ABQ9Y707_9EUKA|nr:hypothetical protein BLNAU_5560 [Blattamonas nauphoetae]